MSRLSNLLQYYESMGRGDEKRLCSDRIEKVAVTIEQKVEVWISTKAGEWLHTWSGDKLLCSCKQFDGFKILFGQPGGDFNYHSWVLENAILVQEELEELYWMWSVAELEMPVLKTIEEYLIDAIEFSDGLEFLREKMNLSTNDRYHGVEKTDEFYLALSEELDGKLASLGKKGLEYLNK